jgi:hypothetical protein
MDYVRRLVFESLWYFILECSVQTSVAQGVNDAVPSRLQTEKAEEECARYQPDLASLRIATKTMMSE